MSHAKLRPIKSGHLHYCPGCDAVHIIPNSWEFNNNYNLPTFTPSVKHNWGDKRTCHYNLVNGEINYCGDCTHELLGQKITLPDIPAKYEDYL